MGTHNEQGAPSFQEYDLENRAYIGNHLTELQELDPEFLEAYLDLAEHPWNDGPLDPMVKEFVNVALSSATTALDTSATREHIGRALDRGATFEEVLEVLELTSILGMHSATTGYPILAEEAELDGDDAREEEIEQIISELEENKEFFSAVWDDILAIVENEPDYWRYLFGFLRHPYHDQILDPKVMEFIYIGIDVGTSHLYTSGLRVHIRNAMLLGATPEEIMEVFQLASATGIQSIAEGMPLLLEEAEKRDVLPESLEDGD
jgi:alkylhydroperoxidase/carboxymuconolactone decarboxylase family protein YurZ